MPGEKTQKVTKAEAEAEAERTMSTNLIDEGDLINETSSAKTQKRTGKVMP